MISYFALPMNNIHLIGSEPFAGSHCFARKNSPIADNENVFVYMREEIHY